MDNLCTRFSTLQNDPSAARLLRSRAADTSADMPTGLVDALRRMELLADGDLPRATLLRASSSAQIYRVDLGWGTLCVKRAQSRPHRGLSSHMERNLVETRWLRFARAVVGQSVPQVLGQDEGLFAMDYLEPGRHPSWLALLRDGEVSPSTAAEVARLIGRLHAASANVVEQGFEAEPIFRQLRIEPTLLAAARAQPALAYRIEPLARSLARTKVALIHGELVPENVLVGPKGPVLLDADCACHGDPAFDVACCLARLLMLGIWRAHWRDRYLTCFDAFCAAYAQRITWEMPEHTERRAALLIPAILLGSVQGDNPVEFLYDAREREVVTGFARKLLVEPVVRLAAVRESWRRSFLG